MKNFLKELYDGLTHDKGEFSHTKFWANIAYATATVVIFKLTYMSQLNENYFLIYLGVVAAHGTASKFLNLKASGKPE
jgi:hypothetical protein